VSETARLHGAVGHVVDIHYGAQWSATTMTYDWRPVELSLPDSGTQEHTVMCDRCQRSLLLVVRSPAMAAAKLLHVRRAIIVIRILFPVAVAAVGLLGSAGHSTMAGILIVDIFWFIALFAKPKPQAARTVGRWKNHTFKVS
jgi:hypothetical protein